MVPPQRFSDVRCAVHLYLFVETDAGFTIPVAARLRYDLRTPYAVYLDSHVDQERPVTWMFGRDLLIRGVEGFAGEGDVAVWPVRPTGRVGERVYLSLQAHGTSVLLWAGAEEVRDFLRLAACVALPGLEREHYDMDALIDRLIDPPPPEDGPW
ncbi:SsgA family sporulation/cell division regulator [Kitasatospora sp. NPDC088134]|uniref:SsgA family sporulation/cell division regulator n=1 Tax=Kitasatospora sp. NPDC088134 TaxID=3364071 RepID=UPI003815BF1B